MCIRTKSTVLSAKYIKERKKIQFPRPFTENRQAQKGAITSIQLFLYSALTSCVVSRKKNSRKNMSHTGSRYRKGNEYAYRLY